MGLREIIVSAYLLGIDIGTHSTKGVLVTREGCVVAYGRYYRVYRRLYERIREEMHELARLGTHE